MKSDANTSLFGTIKFILLLPFVVILIELPIVGVFGVVGLLLNVCCVL